MIEAVGTAIEPPPCRPPRRRPDDGLTARSVFGATVAALLFVSLVVPSARGGYACFPVTVVDVFKAGFENGGGTWRDSPAAEAGHGR